MYPPPALARGATHESNHVALSAVQTANSTSSHFLGPSNLQRSWMSGKSLLPHNFPPVYSNTGVKSAPRKANIDLDIGGQDALQPVVNGVQIAGVDDDRSATVGTWSTEHNHVYDQNSAPAESRAIHHRPASTATQNLPSQVLEYRLAPIPDGCAPPVEDTSHTAPRSSMVSQALPRPSTNSANLLPPADPILKLPGQLQKEIRESKMATIAGSTISPKRPFTNLHLTTSLGPQTQISQKRLDLDGPTFHSPSARTSNTVNQRERRDPVLTPPLIHLPTANQNPIQSRKRPLDTGPTDSTPGDGYDASRYTRPPFLPANVIASNMQVAQDQHARSVAVSPPPLVGAELLARLDHLVRLLQQCGQYGSLERQRIFLLRDACQQNDLCYLCLHQICAIATINGQLLTRQFGFDASHMRGFAIIERLLMANSRSRHETVLLFAAFPFAMDFPSIPPQAVRLINGIKIFLPQLSDGWDPLKRLVSFRRYPPSSGEVWTKLGILSFILQRLLFTYLHLHLNESHPGLVDGAVHLFRVDYHHMISALRSMRVTKTLPKDFGNSVDFGSKYFGLRAQIAHMAVRSTAGVEVSPAWFRPDTIPTIRGEPLRGNSSIGSAQHEASSRMGPPNPCALSTPSGDPEAYSAVLSTVVPSLQSQGQCFHPWQQPSQQWRSNSIGSHGPLPRDFRQTTQGGHIPQSPDLTQPPQGLGRPVEVNDLIALSGATQAPQGWPSRPSNGTSQPPVSQEAGAYQTSMGVPSHLLSQSVSHKTLVPGLGEPLPMRVNPPFEQMALHQAHLMTPPPQKLSAQGVADSDIRLYQIFEGFILNPQVITTDLAFFEWHFNLTADAMSSRVEDSFAASNSTQTRFRRYVAGSTIHRLRCIRIPAGAIVEDPSTWAAAATYWPNHAFASVNGTDLEPRRKTHYGKDLPIDVTRLVRKGDNIVRYSIHHGVEENKTTYAVAVELMKVVNHTQALEMPCVIDAETSLENIISTMATSNDDDIQVTDSSVSIDLIDPFMSRLFNTPVRGRTCTHRDCFDLEAFLLSRTSRVKDGPTNPDEWKCPICNKDARPQCLVIDGFLTGVRKDLEAQGYTEARVLKVMPDGSWMTPIGDDERKCLDSAGKADADNNAASSILSKSRAGVTVDLEDD